MQTTNATTIAELAIAIPSAIPVLERLRIDYCCHGNEPIARSCRGAGITTDELLQLIASETPASITAPAPDQSLDRLTRFIVETHHQYTRASLLTMQTLAAKVRDAHGTRHPELTTLAKLAGEMMADLIPHMLKEEQVLFPYIETMEKAQRAGTEPQQPFFGTVKNPIRMMLLEHEVAGEKMAQMRTISFDFNTPEDACPSYRAFYNLLAEFEADLHRHIHLENNVLFPRAAAMEEQAGAAMSFAGHECRCGDH